MRDAALEGKEANYTPTGEKSEDAYLRTLVADVQLDSNRNIAGRGAASTVYEVDPDSFTLDEVDWIIRPGIEQQFATIERGYIGLVPRSSDVGDGVYVLINGQTLYVLRFQETRSNEKQYQFLGEAYVHGLMDGEALKWLKEGKVELESVVIS